MAALPERAAASVLVGIVTHNRAAVLPKAIASALKQSYRPLAVVVHDDGSSDGTPALADAYPQVDWQRRDPGQGYIRARNDLMLTSTADYYVSLDDDAWFINGDEIAVAVDLLDRTPGAAAVAFDILSRSHPRPAPRGPAHAVGMFIGCGHVLRLSAVRPLGGYADFAGSYGGEEKDLSLRLIDVGFEILQVEGLHVWHEESALARDLGQQHRSGVNNDLTMALRRFPAAVVAPLLAWKLVRHLIFGLRHGLLRPALVGMRDWSAAIPAIWRTRAPVSLAAVRRFYSLSRARA
jgi:glycosyltransferase involved in cell wall biosynthesis